MLAMFRAELGKAAGDNRPCALDEKDNTIPPHADPRGLDYPKLEVRRDLIADTAGQAAVASMIKRLLADALPARPG